MERSCGDLSKAKPEFNKFPAYFMKITSMSQQKELLSHLKMFILAMFTGPCASRAEQGGAEAGTALGSLPMCGFGAGPSTRLLSTLTWGRAGHGQGSSAWSSLPALPA